MNSLEADTIHRIYQSLDQTALKRLSTGWFTEGAGALAVIVLSVLGLAGLYPSLMAAIAVVILGAALIFEGLALLSCFGSLACGPGQEGESVEWGGAIAGKLLGGIGGLVVAIVVLIGIAAPNLLALAVLIFGAAFLFTSMVSVTPGTQEIVGAGAFVLGLLAVTGLPSLTLVLVALVGLGLMMFVNGAVSERRIHAGQGS